MTGPYEDAIVQPGILDLRHETISTLRVEGTPVFDRVGEKIGTVHSLMIGKVDGRVRYAVISFAGFLGIRTHYHPIPWEVLRYNVDLGGYAVEMTRDQLESAPALTLDETEHPIDRAREEAMTAHWGTLRWWGL